MGTNDVKLLGMWASPFVLRAEITLSIKEVAYQYQEEVRENKSELLLTSNPAYQKVPVLIHKGKPVCESMIIVQYIDEVFEGPSILPSDPLERSKARFWAYYIDEKLITSYSSIFAMKTVEAKAQALKQTISRLKVLEDYLAGKPFFGGDNVGFVDIALGSWLAWFKVNEEVENVKLFDKENLPRLVIWAQRLCSDDRVKELMPEHEKLIVYRKVLEDTVWKTSPAN